MTFAEKKLWPELRKFDANFRRQAPIGRYFADFATHHPKLVVEIDGAVHEVFASVALHDAERQAWLEAQGYTVLRFTSRQIDDDVCGCAQSVEAQLALLLDGGGLGGGECSVFEVGREWAPEPNGATRFNTLHSPPSPALPPSRRKGERSSGEIY